MEQVGLAIPVSVKALAAASPMDKPSEAESDSTNSNTQFQNPVSSSPSEDWRAEACEHRTP